MVVSYQLLERFISAKDGTQVSCMPMFTTPVPTSDIGNQS